jgi:uncharacterized coiled-coil protein SlyX
MFNGKMNPVAAAERSVFDRKIAPAAALGVSLIFAGYAVSAVGSGNTLANASSQLISQQSSVVANNIKADAEACATGSKDGSIGHSIKQAGQIHAELASATPNVESLFDVGSDCFSGLNQIYDLSFAIPSLASIVGAATGAVLKYAEKKVCTAVKQVTGMVTSPINQAISKVNGMSSLGDLNGMTNGLIKQGMSKIDPNLGSQYHNSTNGGTYTVGTNPFGSSQVDFGGSTSGSTSVSTSMNGNIVGTNSQINALNQQIANVQAQIGPAQYQLEQAQQQLSSCQALQYNNCTSQQQAVANAQNNMNNLNSQLASLQSQLTSVSPSAYSVQNVGANSTTAPQGTSNNNSFIQSVGKLFN